MGLLPCQGTMTREPPGCRHYRWLPFFGGRSSEARTTGARKIGKDWKELHNLRPLRP